MNHIKWCSVINSTQKKKAFSFRQKAQFQHKVSRQGSWLHVRLPAVIPAGLHTHCGSCLVPVALWSHPSLSPSSHHFCSCFSTSASCTPSSRLTQRNTTVPNDTTPGQWKMVHLQEILPRVLCEETIQSKEFKEKKHKRASQLTSGDHSLKQKMLLA